MRDIKFKFWDSINHYWCDERDYFVNSAGVSMYFGSVEDDPVPEKWVIPVLFTGLKDKNGVEIYCGDLIKNQYGRTAEVVWNKFTASFDSKFVSDDGSANDHEDKSYGFHNADWKHEIEVIGNIYQNQELIENNNQNSLAIA